MILYFSNKHIKLLQKKHVKKIELSRPPLVKERSSKNARTEEYVMSLKSPLDKVKIESLLNSHRTCTSASMDELSTEEFLANMSEESSWKSKRVST